MIVEPQPLPNRDQDLSQKKAHVPQAFRTSWLDAKLDAMAYDRVGFLCFMIVSVIAAAVWVCFVGSSMLRPAATPPPEVAALPPLGLPALPPAPDSSGSASPTIDAGRPTGFEPAPLGSDSPSDDAVPRPVPTQGKVPLAPAHKALGRNESGAAGATPPAKPITVTVRTFHPPVISSSYKDMVADKMKEEGIEPRLEAKIRSGQQLTRSDLASIPKPVMERINKEVVAYGQPPLYTDSTTTTMASSTR